MNSNNPITIKLQISLNRRMYERAKISYNTYSKTNEILISRLTSSEEYSIITHNEMKGEINYEFT
jgi:hypothetical protein